MKRYFSLIIIFLGVTIPAISLSQTDTVKVSKTRSMANLSYIDQPPQPINLDQIRKAIGYPKEARNEEIEGKVVLRILLNESGQYEKHVVQKEGHPLLLAAVEAEITRLRCTSAMSNGKAMSAWVTLPFDFKLKK